MNTNILIPQPTLSAPSQYNNIYFGFQIPPATPAGSYIQTITFNSENTTQLVYATQNSTSANSVQVSVSVGSICYITLSPNTISFGNVFASANVPTNVLVTDSDNGGNAQATMLVYGSNWAYSANTAITFSGSNTMWNPISLSVYGGNALTTNSLSPQNTGIIIPTPTQSNPSTSNSIYFGLAVPPGTPGGVFTQTITVENSC